MTRNLRIDWLYDPESRFHLPTRSIRESLWAVAFSVLWMAAELLRGANLHLISHRLDRASYWAHRRRMRWHERFVNDDGSNDQG